MPPKKVYSDALTGVSPTFNMFLPVGVGQRFVNGEPGLISRPQHIYWVVHGLLLQLQLP